MKNIGPAQFACAGSNFTGEYLGEFETEFENILGCKSGA
jgi:hypothetical protein